MILSNTFFESNLFIICNKIFKILYWELVLRHFSSSCLNIHHFFKETKAKFVKVPQKLFRKVESSQGAVCMRAGTG